VLKHIEEHNMIHFQ